MTIRVFLLPALAAIALSGCGQKGPATSSKPDGDAAPASSGTTATGTAAVSGGIRTIEITANDQMKYSIASLEAKPGEQLRVVLTNVGVLPKEAMAHNWILLKPGSDLMAFSTAAAGAREKGYIPDAMAGQIIAKIDLLGPREKGEVTFKAPDQPGEYPFVCSFPGHALLMKGTLVVR